MKLFNYYIKSITGTSDTLSNLKKREQGALEDLQEMERARTRLGFLPSHDRDKRKAELLQMIRELAPEWDLDPEKIFLNLDEIFYNYAFAYQLTERGGIINISPYFLLKASDLENFRVNGPDDPKLFDDQFLEQAKQRIETILEIKNPKTMGPFNKQDLRIFLVLMNDPMKWEDAKFFILGHELEHLRLKHSYDSKTQSYKKEKIIALSSSTALFAYLCSLGTSIPLSLCYASVAGLVSKWALTKWKELHLSKTQELDADKGAKEKTKKVGGFNHFLGTILECNKAARKASTIYSLSFTNKGEWVLLNRLGHPYYSYSARMQSS